MKKKIKKNRLKIFIALSLMLTLFCGILGISKTYAYDVRDYLGYTSTLDNITNNSFSGMFLQEFEDDGTLKEYLEFNINSSLTWNNFNFNVNVDNTKYMKNYCIILNYDLGYYSSSTGQYNSYISSSSYCQFSVHSVRDYQSPTSYLLNAFSSDSNFNYNFRTQMWQFTSSGANNSETFDDTTNFTFGLRFPNASSSPILRIYNIDFIDVDEVTLSIYYSSLQEQYNQLLTNYEYLQDDYSQLNNEYTQLEDDYNELETNYNELNSDYNDLINTDTNGIWAYFNTFNIGYTNDNNEYQALESYQSLDDFKNSQYNYLNNIEINLSNLKTRYPNVNKFIFVCLASNPPVRPLLNSISYRINNNGNNCQNVVYFNLYDNGVTINYTNLIQMNFRVNYDNINDYIGYYDPNQIVNMLIFEIEYNNSNDFSITSLNNEYNNGYAVGYQNGSNSRNAYINYLDNQVADLTREVSNQQLTINALNEQIEAFSSDYNLNNLMWTIGSTPFESFKYIWNVNFLGVNIADFVLGFITTFIGIWILKKFFL